MSQLQERTLQYYRQQQYQPGWFDLLSVMINGMLNNAGERESQAFLRQMGDNLAHRYPLGAIATVADLEAQINQVLARFNWGFVDRKPSETAIVIDHLALPPGAVLLGLDARWLRGQGGRDNVALTCEETGENSLRFRYQA